MPCTPNVTTLPSATVGELRGPENPLAGPVAPPDSYSSFQISFPSAALRARTTSFPSCREKTNSLSPTRAGVATPSPTGTFHFWVSSLGQVLGAVNPVTLASRLGPRHCGQSSPRAAGANTRAVATSPGRRRRTGCVMVELLGRGSDSGGRAAPT